jgi:hypothetical protein
MYSGVEWNHSSYENHETPKRNINENLEQVVHLLIFEKYLLEFCMFCVLEFNGRLFRRNNSELQVLFTDTLLFGLSNEYSMLSGRKVLLSMMM